jgi:hypothetical protein
VKDLQPPPPDARWVWVSLPRATFALVIRDGRVVDAAPYGRRRIGWDEHRAAAGLRKAGAECVALLRNDD